MTSATPTGPAVCTPAGAAEPRPPLGEAAVMPRLPVYPRGGQPGSPSARLSWQDHAACLSADPGLFFGPDGEHYVQKAPREARAIAVCTACPVRTECLAYAVAEGLKHGVYGGMSEEQRESQRRRQARARLRAAQQRGEAA